MNGKIHQCCSCRMSINQLINSMVFIWTRTSLLTPLILFLERVQFIFRYKSRSYLDWRFRLWFITSAWINRYALTAWRIKQIIPWTSPDRSYASATKTVAAFTAGIHVNGRGSPSRFSKFRNNSAVSCTFKKTSTRNFYLLWLTWRPSSSLRSDSWLQWK